MKKNIENRISRAPINVDSEFSYWGIGHSRALERLKQTINGRTPLTVFSGDPGSGKSTVIRRAVSGYMGDRKVVVLRCDAEFQSAPMHTIAVSLDLDTATSSAGVDTAKRASRTGLNCPVVIVDDAHLLPFDGLLEVLRYAGIGLRDEPEFRIVLVGHDELLDALNTPYSRIQGAAFRLDAMSEEETAGYVRQYLEFGGFSSLTFSDTATHAIFKLSEGNSARVEAICSHVLAVARATGASSVGPELVEAHWPGSVENDQSPSAINAAKFKPSEKIAKIEQSRTSGGGFGKAVERLKPMRSSEVIVLDRGIKQKKSGNLNPLSDSKDRVTGGPTRAPIGDTDKTQDQQEKSPNPRHSESIGRSSSPEQLAPSETVRPVTSDQTPGGGRPGTGIEAVVSFCSGFPGEVSEKGLDAGRRGEPSVDSTSTELEIELDSPSAPASEKQEINAPRPERKTGYGWMRPAAVAASLVAVGFAVYEIQPLKTAFSVSDTVSESSVGTEMAPVTSVALSSAVAEPAGDATAVDPGLSQLAMIEDVASSATGQQSGQTIEIGAVLTRGFERIQSALGEAEITPNDLFRLALEMPVSEQEAALAAYSLAALGGHDRAAYYLGQKYELGEGVPRNLTVARAWYVQGARTIVGAGDRSKVLRNQTTNGALSAPVPLYRQVTGNGELDMVWTIAPNTSVGTFTVELADAGGGILNSSQDLSVTALRQPIPDTAHQWRVGVSSSEGDTEFSDWVPIR